MSFGRMTPTPTSPGYWEAAFNYPEVELQSGCSRFPGSASVEHETDDAHDRRKRDVVDGGEAPFERRGESQLLDLGLNAEQRVIVSVSKGVVT
jgi:hypothetical protein